MVFEKHWTISDEPTPPISVTDPSAFHLACLLYAMPATPTNANPMSLRYKVVSGSPTVKVWNMVMCELGEYQANKALLDGLYFFDGDTMPLA